MSATDENSEKAAPKIAITIPKSAYGPLEKLVGLNEVDFDKFVSALRDASPGLSQKKFRDRVAAKAEGLDSSDVKAITSELFKMDALRARAELTSSELAEVVTDAADEVKSEDFTLSEQQVALLGDRIAKLFEAQQSISTASKAHSLLTDHQNLFINSRLFSDVRAVFSDDASSIKAAVLVHNLVIHYEQDEEHKDFHVSLDEDDIGILRAILDRAETKARTLRNALSRAEIAYLTPSE
jgi:hypothetical protein